MHLNILKLGLSDYASTWELQKQLFDLRLKDKIEDTLILCEHPHTYTIGKNGVDNVGKHLLMNKEELKRNHISVFEIDRGGDITYHGPGQIVGYPILNLNHHYRDMHRYLRDIEEAIICSIGMFGIHGKRINTITGVWVDTPSSSEKICAIGVKVSRWITMHGFALNVNSNLDFFSNIIPCGISDKGVTSMEKILGRAIPLAEVEHHIIASFEEVFKITPQITDQEQLFKREPTHEIH